MLRVRAAGLSLNERSQTQEENSFQLVTASPDTFSGLKSEVRGLLVRVPLSHYFVVPTKY